MALVGKRQPDWLTAPFRNFCAQPFLIVIVVDCHYSFCLLLDFGCLILQPPSTPLYAPCPPPMPLLRHFCCAVCSVVCLLAASHCRACQHNCCPGCVLAALLLLLPALAVLAIVALGQKPQPVAKRAMRVYHKFCRCRPGFFAKLTGIEL